MAVCWGCLCRKGIHLAKCKQDLEVPADAGLCCEGTTPWDTAVDGPAGDSHRLLRRVNEAAPLLRFHLHDATAKTRYMTTFSVAPPKKTP